VLPDVILWQDEMKRDGPANMAIDEWLWFHSAKPVLRIYQWQSDWLSIGYFSKSSEVPDGQKFVRRPTGGGVVEHGRDWAYTLIVPRGHDLAERPGAESYSVIHQALAQVLRMEGQVCSLLAQSQPGSSDYCFVHAVAHDLIDQQGQKLAGAGQRRGKNGLLHQGSVQGVGVADVMRGERLARRLANSVDSLAIRIDSSWVERRITEVYATVTWNHKKS
jgi:lipoate-protein ligase A